jgi:TonB-dependent SusC/RagA subfamily outer membrane receptor
MRNVCALVSLLFGLHSSVKVAAQAVQIITPKIITPKATFTAKVVGESSDTLRKMSCYGPFTYNDRRIPEPLYIIDDKDANSEKVKRISPNDVEKVDVIKGNRAIALYGRQGRNGAIIITTRQHRSKKSKEKGRLN